MKLVVGLGNPGKEYENTRHNLGYLIVEAMLERIRQLYQLNQLDWEHSNRFDANLVEVNIAEQKLILVKPTTFMNSSGQSVIALSTFYKLDPTDLTIIHDELALPLGIVRFRLGGEAAGHNGVASIIQTLNTDNFWRVRIGISTDNISAEQMAHFVLAKFSKSESDTIKIIIDHTSSYLLESLVTNTLQETSFKV